MIEIANIKEGLNNHIVKNYDFIFCPAIYHDFLYNETNLLFIKNSKLLINACIMNYNERMKREIKRHSKRKQN